LIIAAGAALVSSLARAGLNVVDRTMIGVKGVPVNEAVFLNNLLPAVIGILGCALCQALVELWVTFASWRTFVFALLVQAVGYSFAMVLRAHPVERAVFLAKSTDLPIYLVLLPASMQLGVSSAPEAILSGVTTLVCCGYLLRTGKLDLVQLALPATLVLQSMVSPFVSPTMVDSGISSGLAFAIATIGWRTIFSLASVGTRMASLRFIIVDEGGLIFSRAFLALVVQISFVVAIAAQPTAIIWSLLNMSGAISLLLARFLSRRGHCRELDVALLGVVATTLCRLILDVGR
jgi:hypothetical protein